MSRWFNSEFSSHCHIELSSQEDIYVHKPSVPLSQLIGQVGRARELIKLGQMYSLRLSSSAHLVSVVDAVDFV
jgi:hypothetical protein